MSSTRYFNGSLIFSTYFRKFNENPSSGNCAVPCGWTDTTKLTVAFRNFATHKKTQVTRVTTELDAQRRTAKPKTAFTFGLVSSILLFLWGGGLVAMSGQCCPTWHASYSTVTQPISFSRPFMDNKNRTAHVASEWRTAYCILVVLLQP